MLIGIIASFFIGTAVAQEASPAEAAQAEAQADADAETSDQIDAREMKEFKAEVDEAYRLEAERLRDRYQGFFDFLEEKARYNRERMAGAKEMKDSRAKMIEATELARQEQVRSRVKKVDPENDPNLPEWEKEIKAREMAYEKKRELFVLKRTRLQDLRETSEKVPEKKDVGLE